MISARSACLTAFRTGDSLAGLQSPLRTRNVAPFLFGHQFCYKQDRAGEPACIVPDGATVLGLTPIKSTGKRSKVWRDLLDRQETHLYTPSTDKEVLGILGHEDPLAMQLRKPEVHHAGPQWSAARPA